MMKRITLATVVVTAIALVPATAFAADHWASPGGNTTFPCTKSSPCALRTAVGVATEGDRVLLRAGTYDVGEFPLEIHKAIALRAAPGAGRPRIVQFESIYQTTIVLGAPVIIQDLRVEVNSDGGIAINPWPGSDGARIERVIGISRRCCGAGLMAKNGVIIRDSIGLSTGPGGAGVRGGENGGTLLNVTAVGSHPESHGLAIDSCYGSEQHVTMVNTITRGASSDIFIRHGCPGTNTGGSLVATYSSVNPDKISNINFLPMTLGVGNQDAGASPPRLAVNTTTGNISQRKGSPTINTGTADPALLGGIGLGATDVFGNPRIVAGNPDIGAHEFVGKPKLGVKAKRKGKRKGGKIQVRVRCDIPCRQVKISGGVKTKNVKNLKAKKWKKVTVKVKKQGSAKVKVRVTAISLDGEKRGKTIRVKR